MSDGPATPAVWRRGDWGSRWFFMLAAAATLAIVALVALFLTRSREDTLEREADDLALWANVIGESVERVLFDADTHLVAVADRLRAEGMNTPQALKALAGSRETHAWLRELSQRSASLDSLFVVDADGQRVVTSRAFPLPSMDLSDRSYFQALKNRPDLSSFVSESLNNRQIAIDSIYVSQRMNGAQGEFVGVMAASVALPRVVRLLDRAEGSGMSVALVRRNGELLALGSESPERAQALLSSALPALRDALAARDQGAWPALGGDDAPPVAAIRALKGYPLAVLVAQPRARALVAWQQQAQWMAAVTGAAVLLLWGLGAMANRQARLRRTASEGERMRALNAELQVQVDERRQAQDALRTLNEALEARIEARTTELRATMLHAQQASEAKTRFLSHVSHELRTPLNAVLGFAEVLLHSQSDPLRPTQLAQVAQIEQSAEHLLHLINDLLDLSRVEAGELSMQFEALRVGAVVTEALRGMEPLAARHQVTLQAEPHDAALAVRGDRRRLRQVLVNLLSNAIKYNREGGRVTLRAAADSTQGTVMLEVEDTGIGLSGRQQAQLFERFNRLGNEFGSVEGTGIGLTITRELVLGMGGRIEVESTVGVGSRFRVVLPAAAAGVAIVEPGEAVVPAVPTLPKALVSGPGQTLRVLYVEDNPVNMLLVQAMTQSRPEVVLGMAESGAEALRLLAQERPHLLLVDMHLGDMSGTELLAQMRRQGLAEGVRCVALSADALPSQIDAARAAGMDGYLTKPLRLRELHAAYDEALAGPLQNAG